MVGLDLSWGRLLLLLLLLMDNVMLRFGRQSRHFVLGTLRPSGLSLLVAHLLLLCLLGVLLLLLLLHVARLVHGHLLGLGLVRRGRGRLSLDRELRRGQRGLGGQLRLNLDRLQ